TVGNAIVLHDGINRVARGSGNRGDDGAFFADQLIEQRGLADVGAADDSEIHVLYRRRGFAFGHLVGEGVEQHINAETVFGGDGENFVTQFVKLRSEFDGLLRRVHFINGNDGRLAGAAHKLHDFLIERRRAGAAVNNDYDAAGVINGDAGLAQNFAGDSGFILGNDSAGVHDFKGAAFPGAGAVDAVASNARLVGHDRAARRGEAIEQRGLAHIGAADDHDGWKFGRHGDAASHASG